MTGHYNSVGFDQIDELVPIEHYSITHSTSGEIQSVERPLYVGCAVVRSEVRRLFYYPEVSDGKI